MKRPLNRRDDVQTNAFVPHAVIQQIIIPAIRAEMKYALNAEAL